MSTQDDRWKTLRAADLGTRYKCNRTNHRLKYYVAYTRQESTDLLLRAEACMMLLVIVQSELACSLGGLLAGFPRR